MFITDTKKYIKYTISEADINKAYDELLCIWQSFLDKYAPNSICNVDYYIHRRNLVEVLVRTDKRQVYYQVFHGLERPSEYKTTAILCFWINTLKPFMVCNETSNIYNCANEMFAVYHMLGVIQKAHKLKHVEEVPFEYPSAETIKDLVYNLKYCSLNREAVICLLETLANSYGVGNDYLKSRKASTTPTKD